MRYRSQSELKVDIEQAAKKVQVGATYRHYKNKLYKVIDLAIIEATLEVGVIYQALYDERLLFIRPLRIWLETVEIDGQPVPRFKLEHS